MKKFFEWVVDFCIATIMLATVLAMAIAITSINPAFFGIVGFGLLVTLVAVLLHNHRVM